MTDDPWPDLPFPDATALAAEGRAFAASWPGDRAQLAECLGAPVLSASDAIAVVTGQQPAVGGGPLYTLVKVAHACAIADRLRQAGVAAVPVFWCASEDHDLGEADHADLVLADGRLRRVRADLGGGRASLRFRPAACWWETMVSACRSNLRGHLGREWLTALRPVDEDMGAWLCRLLRELFASQGLVCVEAHRLRPLWQQALPDLHARWPVAALAARRQALLKAGQTDAFGALSAPPLFRDVAAGRTALNAAALLSPWDEVSPGAALRPILQQMALPAAFAVLGPGEWAYHRFIAPAYAPLGALRPRLVPRCSLTLVPSWCARAVERWGSSIDALLAGTAAPSMTVSSAALAELDAVLATLAASVAKATKDEQPRLSAGHVRLRRERDRLAASLERGQRRRQDLLPWGALSGWVRPRGQPQDRVMSLFQALWENGPGLAQQLVTTADGVPPGQSTALMLAGQHSGVGAR